MTKDLLSIIQNNVWRALLCLSIISTIASNNVTRADTDDDPFGTQLCNVVQSLSGDIAKSIATVAIFALGVGLFMGKLSWPTAAITSIGVITIFSASAVVGWLSGVDTTSCVPNTTT